MDPAFVSLFALERHLLSYQELLLHCAYMEYQGEAVLFSAPSGTGKTTQADLWEKYREGQVQVINGDRSLLSKHGGCWSANGWPVCGTSGICRNQSFPLKAIVMIRRSPVNHVRRLGAKEAFVQLYSQITINAWEREGILLVSELLEQLLAEVPILELSCNISENAVDTLDAFLQQLDQEEEHC